MLNIVVLVSGGGTNLQALLDAKAAGQIPNGNFVRVISSAAGAYALERAKNAGVQGVVVERKGKTAEEFETALLAELEAAKADLIVLAGFMTILSEKIIEKYPEKIINEVAKQDCVKKFVTIELSMGQMIEDVRLAVNGLKPVEFYGRTGGNVMTPDDIVNYVLAKENK